MDNFLETHSPPKLNQEEIGDLKRPITRSEIESVIKKKKQKTKKTPYKKVQGQMVSQASFNKHARKNLQRSFSNCQKMEEEGTLQRHSRKSLSPDSKTRRR